MVGVLSETDADFGLARWPVFFGFILGLGASRAGLTVVTCGGWVPAVLGCTTCGGARPSVGPILHRRCARLGGRRRGAGADRCVLGAAAAARGHVRTYGPADPGLCAARHPRAAAARGQDRPRWLGSPRAAPRRAQAPVRGLAAAEDRRAFPRLLVSSSPRWTRSGHCCPARRLARQRRRRIRRVRAPPHTPQGRFRDIPAGIRQR